MRWRESFCLSPLHTTAGLWHSEPTPQNFPGCPSPNNAVSPNHLPPFLLLCFVSAAQYGLSASIFLHTFKAYLNFYFLQGGSPKSHPPKTSSLVELLTLGLWVSPLVEKEDLALGPSVNCGHEVSSGILGTPE